MTHGILLSCVRKCCTKHVTGKTVVGDSFRIYPHNCLQSIFTPYITDASHNVNTSVGFAIIAYRQVRRHTPRKDLPPSTRRRHRSQSRLVLVQCWVTGTFHPIACLSSVFCSIAILRSRTSSPPESCPGVFLVSCSHTTKRYPSHYTTAKVGCRR